MRTRIIAFTLTLLMLLCLFPAAAAAEQDSWGVIGGICGTNWNTDFPMTEIRENVWESQPLELEAGSELKVRANGSWDTNYGTSPYWDGSDPVICCQGGRNIVIPADGTYTVTLYLSDPVHITLTNQAGETVLPLAGSVPEPIDPFAYSWTVVGSIFGTDWNTDFQMTETEEGVWQAGPWALRAGEEFKVRADCNWEIWSYGTESGDNCVVEEDGTYLITLNLNNDPVAVTWELTDLDPVEPVIVDQSGEPQELPERIPLTEENFPDANFRAWIAAQDGWTEEEDGVTYLTGWARGNDRIDCSAQGIESLEGIQFFPNLRYLNAGEQWIENENGEWIYGGANALTSFEASLAPNLIELNLNGSQIMSLDVSELSELERLDCAGNGLTSLTLGYLPNLYYLYAAEQWVYPGEGQNGYSLQNRLETLVLSGVPSLQYLYVSGNRLTSLDVSELSELERLDCAGNGIESLTLGELPHLVFLDAGSMSWYKGNDEWSMKNNDLEQLDLSGVPALEELMLSENKLSELNVSHMESLRRLNCENNPITSLTLPDHIFYGSLSLQGVELTAGEDGTYSFNLCSILLPELIAKIDTSEWGEDKHLDTETGVVTYTYLPNDDQFCAKAVYVHEEDENWSEDLWLSVSFVSGDPGEVGWSVIGNICGTNWNTDFPMTEIEEDVWQSEPLTMYRGEMLKIRFGGGWNLNYGIDPDWNGDDPIAYCRNGGNLVIPADDTYTVTLDLNEPVTITLTNAAGETVLPLTEGSVTPDHPDDPGGNPDYPYVADEDIDPATAFNSAGDDPIVPDREEWPAAPDYDGSLDGLPIDEEHFPDANFRDWILRTLDHETSVDEETDEESHFFTGEQLWNVTVIDCRGRHIASLAGIEYFPNLTWLYCGRMLVEYIPEYAFWTYASNPITSLDVSRNPKLERLYAGYCKLTEIDLSQNEALTHLSVFGNLLTELDLTHNALLQELNFALNNIQAFDPGDLVNLTKLQCQFSGLIELDLSGRSSLTELRCCNIDTLEKLNINGCTGLIPTECEIHDMGSLTELRMRNCALTALPSWIMNLRILDCGNNGQFTSLDLSDYRELTELYCDSCSLYRLEISLNQKLTILNCSDNHLKELNFILVPGTEEYGGDFYGQGQTAVCAAGMEASGDGFTFDMTNLVSAENLDRIISVNGAAYDPDTGTATFAEAAETLIYSYETQPSGIEYFSVPMTVTVTLNAEMPELPEGAIPIDAEHFPDANFRAWILKTLTPYYTEDAFGRKYLTETRMDAIYFGLDGWSVASLEGLQYFPNAFSLMCGSGYRQDENGEWVWHEGCLTEVDFSGNPNLVEVYLTGNQLTDLDVSCLPYLQWLGVRYNRLTTLDVSQNYNLAALWCGGNGMTKLYLPGQYVHVQFNMRNREQQEGRLTRLECEDNALTELNLSMQTELKEVSCEDNDLTALDLAENESLGLLDCDDDVAITLPEGKSFCAQMVINDGEKTYRCTSLAAAIDKITGRDGITDPSEVESAYITVYEDLTGPSLEFAEDQQKTCVIDLNGHTYTAQSDPALLAYENNVTVINGTFAVASAPAFKTHSLILSGQIGVNFFMDLSGLTAEERSESYMTFEISGRGTVPAESVPFDPEKMNADRTYYGFTCRVNAIQMADTITATFHYGDGETVTEKYSIKRYIQEFDWYIEDNPDEYDDKTIDLVHALADYGHYAQPFLSDTRGWTLGDGDDQYAAMSIFYAAEYDIGAVKTAVADREIDRTCSSDIEKVTFSLLLDTDTSIYLYFRPVSGYTGGFTVDGYTATKQSDGRYLVKIPNIGADKLGTTYTVVATTDAGDTTVKVSVLSYVKGILDTYTTNTEKDVHAQNAAAAIYRYYAAANAYKQVHP